MASSSTSQINKDATFFVKNFPATYDEYDIFKVFTKFGFVDNVRISESKAPTSASFCIVSMLTLDAADNVRAHLSLSQLQVKDGLSFHVTGFRDKDSPPYKPGQKADHPARDTRRGESKGRQHKAHRSRSGCHSPVRRIVTRILPLHETIKVKVVSHLPVDIPNQLAFSVIAMCDDNNPLYLEMAKDIAKACAEKKPCSERETELKIGHDCLYSNGKRAHRARRISLDGLYLLDDGEIVRYNSSHVYPMMKSFTSLPSKVASCVLDGMVWDPEAIAVFSKFRDVIAMWGAHEGYLNAKTLGYQCGINYIQLTSGHANLAQRLQKRGVCDYSPSQSHNEHTYDRETLLGIRKCGMLKESKRDELFSLIAPLKKVRI